MSKYQDDKIYYNRNVKDISIILKIERHIYM